MVEKQTGQQLSYDAEGQLTSWQNQPNSPTSTVNYLYDGSGTRVAMQANVGGTITTTAYIGTIEEVQTTGSTTQTTTYYMVDGKRIAANVNGTFYYFGNDALGSQVIVLNSSGAIIGSQLYGPYGNQRYSTGTLPTSIGFTGQRADSVTGLDYYVARYYDPVVGVFLSVDSVQGNMQGMEPYAYVGGNPETRIDPTGHRWISANGSQTAWINLSYGNTATIVISSAYGGLSGYAHQKISLLRAYTSDPKNADPAIRSYVKQQTGDRYVKDRVNSATDMAEGFEDTAKVAEKAGYVLLGVGALIDGVSSGMDYYNHHKDQGVGAAAGVGIDHALLSTVGSVIFAAGGEAAGAALGTLICPGVGTVIGGMLGGAIGGTIGGSVGDAVASAWEPAAASIGGWIGSLF